MTIQEYVNIHYNCSDCELNDFCKRRTDDYLCGARYFRLGAKEMVAGIKNSVRPWKLANDTPDETSPILIIDESKKFKVLGKESTRMDSFEILKRDYPNSLTWIYLDDLLNYSSIKSAVYERIKDKYSRNYDEIEVTEILKGARWIIDNFYNVEWKHKGDKIDPDVALSKQILYRKGSDYDIMRPKDSVNVMDFVLHGEDWIYLDDEFFKDPEINCDEL